MAELKEKIEKMEKDIKSLVTNQKILKEEMKNNITMLKKEIKDEVVLVLERRLDENFDILNEKDLDETMSTMTQNINTITQNLSTMTQNHNTLMEVLENLMPSVDHVSIPDMLDASFHVSTLETLAKNQEDLKKETKINNVTLK